MPTPSQIETPGQPTFWGIDEFASVHAISTRQVYVLLQSGALEGRRIGRRTVVTEESAARWRADLPRFESGVPLNAAKACA